MEVVDQPPQDPSQPIPPAAQPPGPAWVQPAMRAPEGPVTRLSKVAGIVVGLSGLAVTAVGGWALVDSPSAGSYAGIVQMIGIGILVIGLPALFAGIGILRAAEWGRGIGIFYSLSLGLVLFAWTFANLPATLVPTSPPLTAADSRSGVFAFAGIARSYDGTGAPYSYETTFGTTPGYRLGAFFVSYQLAPGLTGKVSMVTTSPDGKATADSFDDPGPPRWGYFQIHFESFGYTDGLPFGDYKAVLTFEPTGESVTLPLTITETAPTRALTATVVTNFLAMLLFGLTFVLLYAYSAIVLMFRWRRPATA